MQFLITMFFLALFGGLIGWITSVAAVEMLFKPIKPIKILGFKIQGLIPKRKKDIAKSVGQLVQDELITFQELWDKLINHENKEIIIKNLNLKVKNITDKKLPSFIPESIRSFITVYIGNIINKEVEDFLSQSQDTLIEDVSKKINISLIVEDKINSFDLDKLESVIIKIAHRELYMIELLGRVMGFIIGILQAFIIQFI
ncbi:MAG: DUF445 domain-containing protein [Thermoanaerobacteraceae bacterium]